MAEDKNEGSLTEFLAEAEEIVESLNADLMRLGKGGGKASPDLLNSIFRSAHSLKGLSGMFGFESMVKLSHNLENLLDALRLGKVELTDEVMDILFEAISFIRTMLEFKGGGVEGGIDIDAVSARLNDVMTGGGKGGKAAASGMDAIDKSITSVLTEYEEHRLKTCIKEGSGVFKVKAAFALVSFDQELEELSALLKQKGEIITTLPSPGASPGETINFDIVVGSPLVRSEIEAFIDNKHITVEAVLEKEGAAARPAPVEALPQEAAAAQAALDVPEDAGKRPSDDGLKSITQTVRVDISKLDGLMNAVGELALLKSQMSGILEGMKVKSGSSGLHGELFKASKNIEKKLIELQRGLLETRMVPLEQTFDKLARTVRKVGRELGKDIVFDTRGGETKLDKLIVEELANPLMHLIRNSIDHGLETPSEREAAGKQRAGVVYINAFQRGNHVVVEVGDDGRGIDTERIQRKAVQKGLIGADAKPKKEELLNFMFLPGFSTSDNISEISGRGVGMDVVKASIAALSGMVEIETQKGKGTKVVLILPMTLAIIQALITRTGEYAYAIPLNSILETFMLETVAIETIETREFVHLRDAMLPVVKLSELLGIDSGGEHGNRYVVVVGLADRRIGLIVDDLRGQQAIVIKSIGRKLKNVNVIAGATDYKQETILVLDVGGILDECLRGQGAGLKAVGG